MKNISLFCFFASLFINIVSYFFYIEYLFSLCCFLLIPIFILGFLCIGKQRKGVKWTETEQWILIILSLSAAFSFLYLSNTLGNYIVEKKGDGYVLNNRATYVRDATVAEYHLYMSRISRLFTGFYLVFFYTFFVLSKHK